MRSTGWALWWEWATVSHCYYRFSSRRTAISMRRIRPARRFFSVVVSPGISSTANKSQWLPQMLRQVGVCAWVGVHSCISALWSHSMASAIVNTIIKSTGRVVGQTKDAYQNTEGVGERGSERGRGRGRADMSFCRGSVNCHGSGEIFLDQYRGGWGSLFPVINSSESAYFVA